MEGFDATLYDQQAAAEPSNTFLLPADQQAATEPSNTFLLPATTMPASGRLACAPYYPLQGIDYPGMNDVMCGRGGGTNNHMGNIRFRQLVNEHKLRYLAASKIDKPKVAMEVVQIWRALDPPGRFLTKTDASKGEDSLWHDVGDKKAREKASQCLRERTPDVIPFVKKLQEQEKEKNEKKDTEKEPKANSANLSNQSGKSTEADQIGSGTGLDGVATLGETTPKPTTEPSPDAAPSDTASLLHNMSISTYSSSTTRSSDKASPSCSSGKSNSNYGKESTEKIRRKKTREELAISLPTAASLMKDVFADDEIDVDLPGGRRSPSLETFLDEPPKVDGVNGNSEASLHIESLSAHSWLKSFKSVDGSSSEMALSSASLPHVLDEEDDANNSGTASPENVSPDNHQSMPSLGDGSDRSSQKSRDAQPMEESFPALHHQSMPSLDSSIRSSQKLRVAARTQLMDESQLSLMSDLTEFSTGAKNNKNRSGELKGGLTMFAGNMSEISDIMKDMELDRKK